MKYILILLWVIYLIWAITVYIFFAEKKIKQLNLKEIEESIVIIIPENKLINYKQNPKWIFKDTTNAGIWTWFFINSKWEILTSNHVIENNKINYKIFYKDKMYNSEIISRNKQKDMATLKIAKKINNFNFIKLSKNSYIWEQIYSFWVDMETMEIVYNTWTLLNKKSKLGNLPNLLQISNTLKHGFSGWPVINSNWKVIWINYAISNWKNYAIEF
jgi:S1-C subfamily serine protease